MRWLRRLALSVGILAMLTLAVAGHYYYKGFYRPAHTAGRRALADRLGRTVRHQAGQSVGHPAVVLAEDELLRLDEKAAAQKAFLQRHGFSPKLCFLVDMRIPSGKNRFFVYDLQKDSILLAGLVAHGSGSANFSNTPSFSNISGSGCTSLGKYRVGYPYRGQFGRAYKLYGLDTTNDQAFSRNVVLHSWTGMPEGETYPYPICNSRGCPMVSPAFLKQLQPLIDGAGKPILLWIFN